MSQSLFFAGAVPGLVFFGWFSDAHGRVPAIVLSNAVLYYTVLRCTILYCTSTVLYCTALQVCLVTGLLTPLATDHITFFVLRFLQGLACNSFWSIPYILGEEDRQQKQWQWQQPFSG